MTGNATEKTPLYDARASGPSAPGFGWGWILAPMAWGFVVLAFAAGGLADVTNPWWLVPVFGAAAPVLFVALQRLTRAGGRVSAKNDERELPEALREYGELTPASATTLTVDRAASWSRWPGRGIWSPGPAKARSSTPCESGTGRHWGLLRRRPRRACQPRTGRNRCQSL